MCKFIAEEYSSLTATSNFISGGGIALFKFYSYQWEVDETFKPLPELFLKK